MKLLFKDRFCNIVFAYGGIAALLNIVVFKGSVEYTFIAILLFMMFRAGYILGEYSAEARRKKDE
ncbi:hypothetical protein [Bacillus phage SBSphiJ4]|uniref:Uncharacterized protein n=1 Tax=Bacillus phage Grass TaxID=1406785 RepID=U5PU64_BPGRA|nr:hypothetical protein Grass_194 [Bacillus phage Grass]AGY47459.1 hypothetical protein Grass_194 [Bacillus phage Grass]UPI12710.1 hypothetical protein [Bacillus phage SBSphiJ4]